MEEGIVYVLKNPAFPSLVKIGITTRSEVQIRMSELYTTGVPLPFECAYAGKVDNVKKVEAALHQAFSNSRVNPSREFFELDESQAIAILQLITNEDVTPIVSDELEKVDEVSKVAGKKYQSKRRPPLNFIEMGFSLGDELKTADGGFSCFIAEEKKVKFNDEIMSLTRCTRTIKELEYNIQPTPHWYFNGKSLTDIYDETYNFED